MKDIEKKATDCDILDGCPLKKIVETDLNEFMLNPFKRAAYFGDTVFQKYAVDIFVDEIISMRNSDIQNLAFIDYISKKVFTQYGFDELGIKSLDDSFITIRSMIRAVAKITADVINKAKVDRLDEIKGKVIYDVLYSKHYNTIFKQIVFSRILDEEFQFPLRSVIEVASVNFTRTLELVDLIKIIDGNHEQIKPFAEDVVFSQNFIEREIIFEEIKQKADDYFEAGHFNQRELKFKYYIEKVKASGLKQFEATLTDGTIISLKNIVFATGKVRLAKDRKALIDFEMIKTIEHEGEIVYDKDLV